MNNYLGIGFAAFGAAFARGMLSRYRDWKTRRNALPDDVRNEQFWNDRNYERLEFGISAFWWTLAGVSLAGGVWVLGLSQDWWCWPYQCPSLPTG